MNQEDDEIDAENADPSVPPELLELHLELEEEDTTVEDFKRVFGS